MKYLIPIVTLFIALTTVGDERHYVARVIYSEASDICSPLERYLVASVVKNRVKHTGFGSPKDMLSVVRSLNAFEAVGHTKNSNWALSKYMRKGDNRAFDHAYQLASGDFKEHPTVHFFTNKGMVLPVKYYSKKYWIIKKELDTKYFSFYSISRKAI